VFAWGDHPAITRREGRATLPRDSFALGGEGRSRSSLHEASFHPEREPNEHSASNEGRVDQRVNQSALR
jgi:hypothetical protein